MYRRQRELLKTHETRCWNGYHPWHVLTMQLELEWLQSCPTSRPWLMVRNSSNLSQTTSPGAWKRASSRIISIRNIPVMNSGASRMWILVIAVLRSLSDYQYDRVPDQVFFESEDFSGKLHMNWIAINYWLQQVDPFLQKWSGEVWGPDRHYL